MDFKTRLRELRLENGFTQKELGALIGVGRTTVSEYESGKIVPKQQGLLQLAKILDVSVDYLTGKSNAKTIVVEKQPAINIDLYDMAVRMLELLEQHYSDRHISLNDKIINDNYNANLIALQIQHLITNFELISKNL